MTFSITLTSLAAFLVGYLAMQFKDVPNISRGIVLAASVVLWIMAWTV